MKEYLITKPLVVSGKLVLKGDSFYGEKVGTFVFLYSPKSRLKVGHISEKTLLECCKVYEGKSTVCVPFGIGNVTFDNLNLEQVAVLNYLHDNLSRPPRKSTLVLCKQELIDKII